MFSQVADDVWLPQWRPVRDRRYGDGWLLAGVGAAVGVIAVVAVVLWSRHDRGSSNRRTGSTEQAARRIRRDAGDGDERVRDDVVVPAARRDRVAAQPGLMEVTDPTLGGYDGMLFRFDGDSNDKFYMRNTPMPLSIAFMAADGHVRVDHRHGAVRRPCRAARSIRRPAPYRTAIEVPAGQLQRLGIESGATVVDDHRALRETLVWQFTLLRSVRRRPRRRW